MASSYFSWSNAGYTGFYDDNLPTEWISNRQRTLGGLIIFIEEVLVSERVTPHRTSVVAFV